MPHCYDSPMSAGMQQEEPSAEQAQEDANTHAGLLRRQLLFLRRTWWSSEPVTGLERLVILLRGVFFVAIGGVGLVAAVANTVSAKAAGMEAVAKLIAEFLLIPIAILALIIVGFGGALIVRSFVAPSCQS
jgi:hypothetical protein